MFNVSTNRHTVVTLACCTVLCVSGLRFAIAEDPVMASSQAPNKETMEKMVPPPPANAQMQKVLDQLADLKPKPIETLDPDEARKQPSIADAALALKKKMGLPAVTPPGVDTDDRKIDDMDKDAKFTIRVFTPEKTADNAKLPVLLYIHGGGWVIATNDTYDGSARSLSKQLNAIVVSPEYRKAPEKAFPTSHNDVYATYTWLQAHAGEIKGDATKIAVLGESAGGNMATALCLMAKDKGVTLPVAQVLVYPVTSGDTSRASYKENANAKPLNSAMMKWFTTKEVQKTEDMKSPYLFPLDNADLSGLPPATVIGAQIDPLRDEGKAYADKLKAAGVDTEYKLFDGVTHEFFGLADAIDEAKEAQAFAVARLRMAFGS